MDDITKNGAPEVSFNNLDQETVPMWDHSNKAIVNVPKSDVELALKSQKYTLPKNIEVPIVSPDGELGSMPSDNVAEALSQGFTLEESGEQKERLLEEQYGDQDIAAGLAGAARGLTFGLSDQALTKTGLVRPETLSRLEEANPVSSGIGEVGGFAAGLLGPGQAGALVKGAEAVGKAVERSAAKFITKQALGAGASKTVASSIAEKLVPKMVGSAVEGSFYGAGNLLSEDALGKADFNAENLLGALGTGALIGGAAGGLFGAAEMAAPFAKAAAGKVAKPVVDAVEGLSDKTRAVSELLGMTKKEALRVEQSKLAQELPEYLRTELKMTRGMADDELLAAIKSKREEAGEAIGKISDDVDRIANSELGQGLAPRAINVYGKMEKSIQENILSKLEGTVAGADAVKQIKNVLSDYESAFASKDFLSAKEMLSEMRALDGKLQRFYRDPATAKESIKSLWEVRSVLREEINGMADKVSAVAGIDPGLGQALRKANKDFHITSTLQTPLERKALAKSGLSLKDMGYAGFGIGNGPVGMAAAAFGKFVDSDLRRRMVILSKIEKANLDVLKNISSATKSFFKKAGPIAEKEILFRLNDSALSSDLESGKKPSSRQQAYNNIQENLQNFSANPNKLIDRLVKRTESMEDVAPETAAALTNSAQNALMFLNSKVPRAAQNQGMLDLLENKKMPSSYDLSKFERYLKAVEQPKSVLQDFAKGKLTLEGVEVLKNIYPNMYDNLRSEAISYISNNETKVSYKDKIRLGILLNTPTDASLLPENVVGLQSMFQPVNSQDSGAIKPTVTGAQNLSKDSREATATQRVQANGAGE